MSKKLYVGGLAYAVNDEGLRSMFATVGAVDSAKVITDFDSGRSKGFGFVEMATDEDASAAIQKLNGSIHEGRTITVSEAKPKEAGRGGNRGRSGGGRGRPGGNGGGGRFNNGGSGRFGGGNRSDFHNDN